MKIIPLLATLSLLSLPFSYAAEPPSDAQAESKKLLAAIAANDYAAFLADGDTDFKSIKKPMFDSVVSHLTPRMKTGYEVIYLGELKQRGYQVTLWKLSFKDGQDDLLATLSLKDGMIGGYLLQ